MEEEFKNLMSRLEMVVSDIERVERRVSKLHELAEKAKADGRETVGYDLAREEYQNQISRIVNEVKGDFKSLEKYELDLEGRRDDLEKEKLKKMAMCEVERELNEDPAKVNELENEIRGFEDKIKGLNETLGKIRLIKEKLQPYMPKPPSECSHPRKRVISQFADMRDLGRTVLYECPDCGKRWRE
jgi:chromosome segregation ATPase